MVEIEMEGLSKSGGLVGRRSKIHNSPPPNKIIRLCEMENGCVLDKNWLKLSPPTDQEHESQDADFPSLSDEIENLILARVPRSEYLKFRLVNKRFLTLLKKGEIFKIRREIGVEESSVFMLVSGETNWCVFDRDFKTRKNLPNFETDSCFISGDKETFCAGTNLFVSGKEIDGLVIWRYELATNSWSKGPSMKNPRCLFASATFGETAYVAGGIGLDSKDVFDTAERYNNESQSWEALPRMKKKRQLCSGFYMDKRFYVIGGRNEEGELTCGEFFDEGRNRWEIIPGMLRDNPVLTSQSPPLLAVVNNELYSLEANSNQLKVYLKGSNVWKQLGPVPVRADSNSGWGVAFKSLGSELLVIGASSSYPGASTMAIFTCRPCLEEDELFWKPLGSESHKLSHFIHNCSVMVA
ncbi:F-box/kelch-repeat protein At3g27150-like [Impatiens glandulifera]|uniref:F-box/kelch-repeat protein At3g27150-like n=1 Tax=Impatiens glandulifera TaxID=253017 RepID=UPI001FB05E8E|nr:F-box/kelch-repeat protein At3g27150-like [Impatiens glandulifera]XP_047314233.1 F-box/kelch-repeat protein At3g27150-like [Impatiens glandulifera]XP_047314237.1 F-box/kelch-repeat protein At3g27150-like [Impatiens glandulifera]